MCVYMLYNQPGRLSVVFYRHSLCFPSSQITVTFRNPVLLAPIQHAWHTENRNTQVQQHEDWTLPLFGLPAQVWVFFFFFFGLSADKPMKCDFYNITYLDFSRSGCSGRSYWILKESMLGRRGIRQCRYRGSPCRYVRDVWTNKSDLIMYTNQRVQSGLKIWFGCCLRTAYSSVLSAVVLI